MEIAKIDQAGPQTYIVAPHPFNKPSADTILRSSDNVDFRVRRGILIECSSFFEDMFSLPRPRADASQIEPIPVAENSRVLNVLLRLCYPLDEKFPNPLELEDAHIVLKAATKYDIPVAVESMRRTLLAFVPKHPLRVFAIACLFKWEPGANRAAEEAAKQKVAINTYFDEFEDLSAGCCQRLLQFQQKPFLPLKFVSPTTSTDQYEPDGVGSRPSQHLWQDAGQPFDRPDADVVVVSRDQVRFRVHSTVLKIVSPVFAQMLLSPQPYPDGLDEVCRQDAALQNTPHYIGLPEHSEVLKVLFGLIYHSRMLDFKDPSLLRAVTTSAMKYSIQGLTLQALKSRLCSSPPLSAFFSAFLCGWEGELGAMAKRSLQVNNANLAAFYEPSLETIPSRLYIRLLQYRDRCCKAACAAIYEFEKPVIQEEQSYCSPCRRSLEATLSVAFKGYQWTVKEALLQKPHSSVLSEQVFSEKTVSDMMQRNEHGCHNCRKKFLSTFWDAASKVNAFKKAVDKAISKVDFVYP